ncbi:MAG: sigma-54-dependent Fis family transcriptional regulator [Natronospirillum sp.]|nr:sigma-54-dependent Fis family transcriptional regulator [Natronospirillum sp.]MCH8551497.1 sigma-54-dependent Fis family transcriptional regulator [Natronospirillum sp.]
MDNNNNPAESTEHESAEAPLTHQEVIEKSWYRCESYGLSHGTQPDFGDTRQGEVSALVDQHQNLIHTTENEVLPYYENILSNSSCLIVLADNAGHVLNTWGASRFRGRGQHGLVPGHQWQEMGVGTNAIGTALATGQPVQVSRDEHFLRANRYMVGSASPIYDTRKEMIGVLDISSDAYLPQDHTLGMVKLMSLSVENQLIYAAFQNDHYVITFSTNISGLDSHWAGMLVLDDRGVVVSANRRAWVLLAHDLALMNIENIFGCSFRELSQQPPNVPLTLRVFERYRMWVRVQPPLAPPLKIPDFRIQEQPAAPASAARSAPPERGDIPPDVVPFDELEHGDKQVRLVLTQARKIIEKDIPILIRGETGAGKEILVRSLHFHSSRKRNTLVAVNCASIPTELVESELFGYEKGAFTGASTKGSIGLIRRAHGGTLFLDEIGEMPLHVQARLLRVLQERVVVPLGSSETFPVDIRLVSATNRDLKSEVDRGQFRQDLYYRISGLNIELPALRNRHDKAALIHYVYRRLEKETGEPRPLSPQVHDLLVRHPWPGNVRQLVNVLKIAHAMSEPPTLEADHLPADFYDDFEQPRPEPTSVAPPITADLADSSDRVQAVLQIFEQTGGNVSRTARLAGVSRNTVYKYVRENQPDT